MVKENIVQKVNLPEGISASVKNGLLTIKGPKGDVSRNLFHPKINIIVDDENVSFEIKRFTQKEKKIVQTFIAHLKNMFKGVTQGHEYKLKICSGHFPMNVSIKGKTFEVKNFIGEAVPRLYSIKDNVDVKLNAEIIQVSGIDKELVAQTAASIEQLTRRVGFDTRIFQDGIYIIEKDGKSML